jgi:hypothetical protein
LKIEGHSGRFIQQADWRDNITMPVVAMAESFAQSLLGASSAGEKIKMAIVGSAPEWRQCASRLELHGHAKRTSFALATFWKCVHALDEDGMIHFAADAGPTMESIGALPEVSDHDLDGVGPPTNAFAEGFIRLRICCYQAGRTGWPDCANRC